MSLSFAIFSEIFSVASTVFRSDPDRKYLATCQGCDSRKSYGEKCSGNAAAGRERVGQHPLHTVPTLIDGIGRQILAVIAEKGGHKKY